MKNKRLLILIVIFVLVLGVYLFQLFKPDSSIVEEDIGVIEEPIIEPDVVVSDDSSFGYIEDMDFGISSRDPFDYPSVSKEEYEKRENEFITKLQYLIKMMEVEKALASGENTSVDSVVEKPVVENPVSDSSSYDSKILEVEKKFNLPNGLISSIISHGNNNASYEIKNSDGSVSRGLMMINSNTAPWIAKELGLTYESGMELDPLVNIEMGGFYLNHLKNILEDTEFMLTAYNLGPQGAYDLKRSSGSYSSDFSRSILNKK